MPNLKSLIPLCTLFSTVLDDDGFNKKTQYNVLLSCIRGFLTSCIVYIIFPVYNLSHFPAVVLIIPFWCPNVSRKYIPADSVLHCLETHKWLLNSFV